MSENIGYEDRILKQKFQIKTLVSLYVNSRDIGRTDTLDGVVRPGLKKQSSDPALLVKSALRKAKLFVHPRADRVTPY